MAAERAIMRAKATLAHVSSAKWDIIAQTIAMAEAKAIAEAEEAIKKECEDYKSRTILCTASELQTERWENQELFCHDTSSYGWLVSSC